MTTEQTTQHAAFKAAKEIALSIGRNQMRRASIDGLTVNYYGANINGRMYVIGDTAADIQQPDATINGMPAREIFGDFTVMSR